MKRQSCALLFLLSLLCLAWPACSPYKVATTQRNNNLRAYAGPPLPKDSVGYLGCTTSDLEIAEVDAVPTRQLKTRAKYEGSFNYIELVPGKHAVLVKGSAFRTVQRGVLANLFVR